MTYTESEESTLIINQLTKAQYEAITPEPNQLYLTPDTTEQDIADAISAHNTSNTAHSDIRNAIPTDLGDLTNDAGYTKNVGTVTSVNSTSPDGSGNVALIPPIAYGTSTTSASTAEKVVSIPEITTLNSGQIIVVSPTKSASVADLTIKLNNFPAYPILYTGSAITTSTDNLVWNANQPSAFVFNGTNWLFLCHGLDSNTTYSTMSVEEGVAGTATSNRTLQAANLKQIIQETTLTGLDTTTNTSVAATDDITTGIGKLQAQIDNIGGGGTATDVQINGTSITSSNVANIVTNTAYNASSNKIATMSDVPSTTNLANKDLSNLSSTGEARFTAKVSTSACAEVYPVIQTYRSGTSWYRIYSDGWCEMGGESTSSSTVRTVTFLKTFADTNYTPMSNKYGNYTGTSAVVSMIVSKTTSSMDINNAATNYPTCTWTACGYLAEGQY